MKLDRKTRPLLQVKLADDVLPHPFRRGGGQGNHRHRREVLPQLPQVAVVGPKLVAPLGDAVGLVDRDEAQVQAVEEPAEPG